MEGDAIAGIVVGGLAFIIISAYLGKLGRRWMREWNIELEAVRYVAERQNKRQHVEMISLQERRDRVGFFESSTPYVLVYFTNSTYIR